MIKMGSRVRSCVDKAARSDRDALLELLALTERVPDELKNDIDVWRKLTDNIGSELASSRFLDR